MSMNAEYYTIIGYDLTNLRNRLYTNEFIENEEVRNKWECFQIKGNIQLFPDYFSDCHLYFGYIVSANDEYDDFESAAIDCLEIENKIKCVMDSLSEVFPDMKNFFDINALPAKVISFCELR